MYLNYYFTDSQKYICLTFNLRNHKKTHLPEILFMKIQNIHLPEIVFTYKMTVKKSWNISYIITITAFTLQPTYYCNQINNHVIDKNIERPKENINTALLACHHQHNKPILAEIEPPNSSHLGPKGFLHLASTTAHWILNLWPQN